MNKKWRRLAIVSVIVSAASLLIISLLGLNYKALENIGKINLFFLACAFGFHFLSLFFWGIRIKTMAGILNERISLRRSLHIVLVNVFVGAITPSQIGGEPTRIKMLTEEGLSSGGATGLVVSERIVDFIFLMSFAPIIFFLAGREFTISSFAPILYGGFILLIILLAFFIFVVAKREKGTQMLCNIVKIFVKKRDKRDKICKKIEKEMRNFSDTMKNMLWKKSNFFKIILPTAALWICDMIVPSIILLALGQNPYWLFSLAVQFLIMIATMLPLTPGGSGIAEFGSFILYAQVLPIGVVSVLTILWRITLFYTNLIVGFVFTFLYLRRKL